MLEHFVIYDQLYNYIIYISQKIWKGKVSEELVLLQLRS